MPSSAWACVLETPMGKNFVINLNTGELTLERMEFAYWNWNLLCAFKTTCIIGSVVNCKICKIFFWEQSTQLTCLTDYLFFKSYSHTHTHTHTHIEQCTHTHMTHMHICTTTHTKKRNSHKCLSTHTHCHMTACMQGQPNE